MLSLAGTLVQGILAACEPAKVQFSVSSSVYAFFPKKISFMQTSFDSSYFLIYHDSDYIIFFFFAVDIYELESLFVEQLSVYQYNAMPCA